MKREALLGALRAIAPAAAGDVGVMGCFCFGAGRISAYDGSVGMWAELDAGITALIPANKLLPVLSACDGDEVTLTQKGEEVTVVGGHTRLRLRSVTGERFLPAVDEDEVAVDWNKSWTKAVLGCGPAMSEDINRPELMGITIVFNDEGANCYATDSVVAIRTEASGDISAGLYNQAFILPPKYAGALKALLAKGKGLGMRFGGNYLHAVVAQGGVEIHLLGNMISEAVPDKYQRLMAASQEGLCYVDLPDEMAGAIARAEAFAAGSGYTKVTVSGGKATLETTTDAGSLKDTMDLEGHPDVTMAFQPAKLRPMLEGSKEVAFGEACMSVRSERFLYVQASAAVE
jgi:hypothetical protein